MQIYSFLVWMFCLFFTYLKRKVRWRDKTPSPSILAGTNEQTARLIKQVRKTDGRHRLAICYDPSQYLLLRASPQVHLPGSLENMWESHFSFLGGPLKKEVRTWHHHNAGPGLNTGEASLLPELMNRNIKFEEPTSYQYLIDAEHNTKHITFIPCHLKRRCEPYFTIWETGSKRWSNLASITVRAIMNTASGILLCQHSIISN